MSATLSSVGMKWLSIWKPSRVATSLIRRRVPLPWFMGSAFLSIAGRPADGLQIGCVLAQAGSGMRDAAGSGAQLRNHAGDLQHASVGGRCLDDHFAGQVLRV